MKRFGTRRSAGFTLISQLVGLGIVSILFAIAVPSYMSMMPRVRLQGATRQLVSDLMFARMKAVRENNRHRVVFTSNQRYDVLSDGESGEGVPVLARDLSGDYPGVVLVANNDPVFSPGGRASSLATITLTNEAGQRRLSVNITGRVRIQ
jgi:type IV fimbrial biogenesis protein FimT